MICNNNLINTKKMAIFNLENTLYKHEEKEKMYATRNSITK